MDKEDTVHRGIGKRQKVFHHERGFARPAGRPMDDALPGRHEGQRAGSLTPEQAEIGRGIAQPQNRHAPDIAPVPLQRIIHEPSGHDAQRLTVECA